MRFGGDMVNRFSGCPDTVPAALLTKVLVTREDAGPSYIPRPPVAALMSALARLIVTPAITGMLLLVGVTIAARVTGDIPAAFVPTGPLSSCWHRSLPER